MSMKFQNKTAATDADAEDMAAKIIFIRAAARVICAALDLAHNKCSIAPLKYINS